jgi:hypothetical protein
MLLYVSHTFITGSNFFKTTNFCIFIHVFLLLLGGPSVFEQTKPKKNVPHRFLEYDLKR